MGNKRVSQLVELTAPEVSSDDLFLIIDTSFAESKKIHVSQLAAFLSVSGSLIAEHAAIADVALFVLGSNVSGPVSQAVFASTAGTATTANFADNATSASYAKTASWAINTVNGGSAVLTTGSTYPITSSWAINANTANIAGTASVLLYIPGVTTNTASFAITSSFANVAAVAQQALSLSGSAIVVTTASYALVAGSTQNVTNADTASFLQFNGVPNGTASYAITSKNTEASMKDFGMFFPISQTDYAATINDLYINSSLGSPQTTIIEALGTALLSFTSSIQPIENKIYLTLIDRVSGQSGSLDSSRIAFDITPVMNHWDSLATGSIYFPFDLTGQFPLNGDYYVTVTSSNSNLKIDTGRSVKFRVYSFADTVNASFGPALDLFIDPQFFPITFSTDQGGPFVEFLPSLLATGSYRVKTMDISNQSITTISYTWVCTSLTDFSCSNNPGLTTLNYGFPGTMFNFYCSNCNLTDIIDLSNTNLHIFKCDGNQLINLPNLPFTTQYIDCSNNPLGSLPTFLPNNLNTIICKNVPILNVPIFGPNILSASFNNCGLISFLGPLPDSMETLSLSNNSSLTSLPMFPSASLPASMSYLDISLCGLNVLPSMSISMSYLNISSNPSMTTSSIETITGQLVANGFLSGTFISVGNGIPSLTTYINLLVLSSSLSWSIDYTGFP